MDVGVTPSANTTLEGKMIVAAITITLNNRLNAAVLLIYYFNYCGVGHPAPGLENSAENVLNLPLPAER